jgi:hypothetical protein
MNASIVNARQSMNNEIQQSGRVPNYLISILAIIAFLAYRLAYSKIIGGTDHAFIGGEEDHVARIGVFVNIYLMDFGPSNLELAYSAGIWPALFPALMALSLTILGKSVVYARLINMLFQLFALLIVTRCFETLKMQALIRAFFITFPALAQAGWEVRLENLSLLLLAAFLRVVCSSDLFSTHPPARANTTVRDSVACGTLAALIALNHGVVLIFILCILFLMLTSIRYSWPGLAVLLIVVAPYTTVLQLMHSQVVLTSAANPSNLA